MLQKCPAAAIQRENDLFVSSPNGAWVSSGTASVLHAVAKMPSKAPVAGGGPGSGQLGLALCWLSGDSGWAGDEQCLSKHQG